MGREIRKVPPNWEHPLDDNGELQPMHNSNYEEIFEQWLSNFDRIRKGNLDDFEKKCYPNGLRDWLADEQPPNPEYYRWYKDDEATWFQLYETVSEGTPLSPPFATKEELVDYLTREGDTWSRMPWSREKAEAFVEQGWVPSMIMTGGKIIMGEDMPLHEKEAKKNA